MMTARMTIAMKNIAVSSMNTMDIIIHAHGDDKCVIAGCEVQSDDACSVVDREVHVL